MKIYIVGNPMVTEDSLPYVLRPFLVERFPDISIEEADPNENFVPEDGSIIIDTVLGISDVRLFENIDAFMITKSVSPHDYDLGFHLQLLKKLHKITAVKILGLPQERMSDDIKKRVISAIDEAVRSS